MKKIISTLALATLAFGSVFADVTFTTNYRTRMVGFSRVMNADGYTNTDTQAEKFTSYLFKHNAYGSASDTFKVEVGNDFGGAGVRVDPNAEDGNDSFVEYYGYATIGSVTLTAGLIDGISNDEYRLTDEVGKSNLGGESTDAYAPGSMHGKAITFQADDIAYFDGANRPVGMLTYNGDFGDTKITADLVAAAIDVHTDESILNSTTTWDGSKMHSALGFRVNAKLPAAGIQLVFKQHVNTTDVSARSIALHVAPAINENISLAFGGATGFYNGELTEFNADIRFVFKTGNISITSLNTIGFITDAGVSNYDPVGYDTHVGLSYLKADGTMGYQTNAVSQSSMWNLLAFRMEASEKLAVFCNIGDVIGFNAAHKEIGDYGMEFFVAPGFQFYAAKNCSISTALRVGVSNLLMDDETYKDIEPAYGILVPVVLRVKL